MEDKKFNVLYIIACLRKKNSIGTYDKFFCLLQEIQIQIKHRKVR